MTLTLDPGTLLQIAIILFGFGAAWAGLSHRMRFLEKRQDITLEAYKKNLDLELAAIRDAHAEHVARYEREHGELRGKLDAKGEAVSVVIERVAQVEKRLDEKFATLAADLKEQFREMARRMEPALTRLAAA